jgi:hypothetical protein
VTMMSRGSTPAFVGRVPELSTLIDAFEAARAGRATTALVGGEAGVGKSRLVRELGAHARRSDARVLVGHCLDLEEGGLPYAPFVDILRTLERELPADEGGATIGPLRAALGSPPGDASTESPGSAAAADPFGRARVFELLLTLLDRLTASDPVVLVIEDIHWADRSTDDLITLLSTGARHLPLLLAATYRTDDGARRGRLQDLLAELTRRGVTQVRLRRLDRGEVVELASALLGGPPSAELAAGIADRSDGNPLFVEELVAAVADDPAAPMPPHLRDAVLSRVRRMPPNAAATLRACAVGGRQVEHDLLAGALGIAGTAGAGDDELGDALRTCVDQQLLVTDNELGGYRFRHALVHEAVLDEILPGELAPIAPTQRRSPAVVPEAAGPRGVGTVAIAGPGWLTTGRRPATTTPPSAPRSGLESRRSAPLPSPKPTATSSGACASGIVPSTRSRPPDATGASCWRGPPTPQAAPAPSPGRSRWSPKPWTRLRWAPIPSVPACCTSAGVGTSCGRAGAPRPWMPTDGRWRSCPSSRRARRG